MYAYIKGELVNIKEDVVIIDVRGVGYEIFSPNPEQYRSYINETVKIHTYHYVREDAQVLYGFKDEEEKELFKKLLNVSGIGPKNALSIIGQTRVGDFALAIEREDDGYLTKFPGIGKKTARQMILDLKGKVSEWMINQPQTDTTKQVQTIEVNVYFEEAIEALKALGYSSREINGISNQLRTVEAQSTDDVIKKGLQLLMR